MVNLGERATVNMCMECRMSMKQLDGEDEHSTSSRERKVTWIWLRRQEVQDEGSDCQESPAQPPTALAESWLSQSQRPFVPAISAQAVKS